MSSSFDLSKPIAIGSDHAGFDYKVELIKWLNQKGLQVQDMGVYENKSVDYPDYAHPVATSVEKSESAFGILLCGTGNGVCMTANKHQNIRAAMCWESDVAKLVRQHNDANIICLPARFIALEFAKSLIEIFIETGFEGGRHARRVDKIACA
ncbi:MAG: ribose 5-phosphate isomerase B [Bacteroidetes bacterium]|nr:ribose 5-phosphate isomerase B [Bacteroidota bacterium]